MPAKILLGAAAGGVIGYFIGKDKKVHPIYERPPERPPEEELEIEPEHLVRKVIGLDGGLTAYEWPVKADTLIVERVTGTVSVRFDDLNGESISLNEIEKIVFSVPFWRIFFDAPAQPGASVSVAVGTGLELHRPAIPTGLRRADLFNIALPTLVETNWLPVSIRQTLAESSLRISVCVTVAGILRVVRIRGGVTVTENLNAGATLIASALYIFDVLWSAVDEINFRYSVSGGIINSLLVQELKTL